ncbi:N-acyl homoserine lactonase family protein [Flavihumibacter profundi]|uniref:N-acyl homoserine lactonase family protein n=1 Tax=Flavihumibacter profundi TaxID=2716883 RepID=UPI001CC4740D|nr:N-acyl homoserine lactonase family protein [Flavihumibacter profundi]MBZ5856971.1 N-acyl homoserine lactonase family protein [Flavihumibacter profundi]
MKNIILFVLVILSLSFSARSQTDSYAVYAIRFASMGKPTPVSAWSDQAPDKDSVNIDFMVWLIKGKDGKNILLDAGFLNDIEDAKDFGVVNYVRPDSALEKLGLKAADITDIIISHPHWDHIDGSGLFPNAHVWMQKDDFNYFVGSAWQKDGDHGGFNPRDVRLFTDLNLAGRLTLVDGDNKEIIPGIKVFTGSRHTFNSQYVLVETGSKKIVLASDNIWVYYSLDHLVPASKGGTLDNAGYVKTMQRMKTQASGVKYIIPGHDAKVFSIFPAVASGVVAIK